VVNKKGDLISGRETHTGLVKDAYKIVVDKPDEKCSLETLHVQRRIILKLISRDYNVRLLTGFV
jgi:hypothetical protein